jgi:hypothetical protein
MARAVVLAVLGALLVAGSAQARTPRACKRLHGHARTVCVRKHTKPKPRPADPLGIPVKTTVLDGSTLTTAAGTFGITGELKAFLPGKVQLDAPTFGTFTAGSFSVAAGAPCSAVEFVAPSPYGATTGLMVLNADGSVLVAMHVNLPDCGGPALLLLGGKVGDTGLNSVVLDSVPGAVTAHLVVKVDLSGQR